MIPKQIKDSLLKRLTFKESWIIFFFLGLIMLNYPFLNIFNKTVTLLGFPVMFIYIFGGWAVSILVIYLFVMSIKNSKSDQNGSEN